MGGVSISIALWYAGGAYAMPLGSFFPPSPSELFASIQYPKITKLFTVALFLEQLIRLLRQDDNIGFKAVARLKFVAYGGAACPPHVCKELVERGVNLITTYGSTG
jgi:acyl-coenzyme A synthetase/AMP-(fatty) acid ligase